MISAWVRSVMAATAMAAALVWPGAGQAAPRDASLAGKGGAKASATGAPASRAGRGQKPAARKKPAPPPAKSVGAPNAGRLEHGVRLQESESLRFLPEYDNDGAHYGLPQLVGLLERVAKGVRQRWPGAVMGLGHLSNEGGGSLPRHASHASGRDADVALYAADRQGKPLPPSRLWHFDSQGIARGARHVRLDLGRNWELLAALATDPKVRVSYLFLADHVRDLVIAHGAKLGASAGLRAKVRRLTMQPRGAALHDDHVHVRIACPSGQGECTEQALARASRRSKPPAHERAAHHGAGKAAARARPQPTPDKTPAGTRSPAAATKGAATEDEGPIRIKPRAKGRAAALPPDEPEAEGLDRLVGPSVQGLGSIVVPSKPLYVDDEL